ncbi:7020_t:CDS:2 [Paraglomus brasilianum]|uniref:7020_t:CDS:1 n=1 Tax=Paraglomus brasilianum TaxID=144538 RepID=A0A9N8ZCT7_9GLOM|nr:7020_t:CDS:2 [Paraglomus brasilianum]
MYPKIVKAMFINKSIVHPTSKSTPNGGKITAKINLKMSEHVPTWTKPNGAFKKCALGELIKEIDAILR